jgi:hypothetical protein
MWLLKRKHVEPPDPQPAEEKPVERGYEEGYQRATQIYKERIRGCLRRYYAETKDRARADALMQARAEILGNRYAQTEPEARWPTATDVVIGDATYRY